MSQSRAVRRAGDGVDDDDGVRVALRSPTGPPSRRPASNRWSSRPRSTIGRADVDHGWRKLAVEQDVAAEVPVDPPPAGRHGRGAATPSRPAARQRPPRGDRPLTYSPVAAGPVCPGFDSGDLRTQLAVRPIGGSAQRPEAVHAEEHLHNLIHGSWPPFCLSREQGGWSGHELRRAPTGRSLPARSRRAL